MDSQPFDENSQMIDEKLNEKAQSMNEESQPVKKRTNEALKTITEQQKAIQLAMNGASRRFRLESVEIETTSGNPVVTAMWVTDDEYVVKQPKEKEIYKCEFCNKEFNKKRNMLVHARYHTK